jgi:nitrogen fixation/metabolism regulation signal transduction histidine kinase
LTAAMLLSAFGLYKYVLLLLPVIVYQVITFYHAHRLFQKEVINFLESVRYRDFSRHFNIKKSPKAFKELYEGFNEVNVTFKAINKEKETQHQYLRKILELVDTGILSYEEQSGEVIWINESLKQLLQTPYLKTIHSLERRNAGLYAALTVLKPGDKNVVEVNIGSFSSRIILSATTFHTEGKQYKIVAVQNISKVIDETEAQSWQKLLRVMTHEIMNSVAPIASLAETLKNRLEKTGPEDSSYVDDLETGLDTIKKRSNALLKFTEAYRNLNKVTTLNRSKIYIRDLFEDLYSLMQPTLEQKNIELDIILKDTSLSLEIDKGLIEQVIINLIINAMEAMTERGGSRIVLTAFSTTDNIVISITDNGPGIPDDISDKIFIPFFSTKKNGNGIGLSLCKQIMLSHKGDIQLHSTRDEGTAFSLYF